MEYKECHACPGYCCYYTATIGTPITEEDITRIAAQLQLSRDHFISTYITPLKGTRERFPKVPDAVGKIKAKKVCPFLRASACFIHNVKPKFCSDMKPVHIGGGVSCREWHRVRAGVVEK